MEKNKCVRKTRAYRSQNFARAFCALISLVMLCFVFCPLKAYAGVVDSFLRFHVVANSDSAFDQDLKLEVRDRLLEWTGESLSACENREEARLYLSAAKEGLLLRVRNFLQSRGVSYGAEADLLFEHHAAKDYGDVSLPAGEYLTFRLTLGKGEGQNFFCVLFPPMCKNTAKRTSEVLFEYKIGSSSRKLVTQDGVSVRFGLWEGIRRLFDL